jgi:hypothetical protein
MRVYCALGYRRRHARPYKESAVRNTQLPLLGLLVGGAFVNRYAGVSVRSLTDQYIAAAQAAELTGDQLRTLRPYYIRSFAAVVILNNALPLIATLAFYRVWTSRQRRSLPSSLVLAILSLPRLWLIADAIACAQLPGRVPIGARSFNERVT